MLRLIAWTCLVVSLAVAGCASPEATADITLPGGNPTPDALRLVMAAESQIGRTTKYDPGYVEIEYPGGDVPIERGVCTDVVVRAFRELEVDLQVEVHEDMAADFEAYPQNWGLEGPNSNIDHRRVPNLRTYFERSGYALEVTQDPEDYWPGDVVTWDVNGLDHMGIVTATLSPDEQRYCIVHNFGAGVRVEDALFTFPVTGHYRPF